jgi:hypothetical protein
MPVHRQIAIAAALAAFGSFSTAHAQQDLKPLQAETENLKQQVSRLPTNPPVVQPKTPPKPQSPTKPTRTAPATKDAATAGPPKDVRTSPAPQ